MSASENGMAAEMSRVIRHSRRNRYRISTANAPPTIVLVSRLFMLSWIIEPWLKNVKNRAPPRRGSCSSSRSSASTASHTATALALESLRIAKLAASFPSIRLMLASRTDRIEMSAMSSRVTPSLTGKAARASMSSMRDRLRTYRTCQSSSMRPPAIWKLSARRRPWTSPRFTPWASIASRRQST